MFPVSLPRVLSLLLFFGLSLSALLPSPSARCAAAPVPPVPWERGSQNSFITSLCDDHHGHVFLGTEDQGLWRYDPAAPTGRQYAHFTTKDGLADDDVYALLVDAKGRLWAGTRRGLSVYNGKRWKTYGPREGLGGSRVFALAACPVGGDVWIATEGGLTRYSLAQNRWRQYSRRDGLPSDAVGCLAFDARGNLYAGTQADGLAIASPKNDYHTWRVVRGPGRPPDTPRGDGLPASLINCLLVSRSGSVYCGTTAGLAHSEDGGRHWRFLRGADWRDKARDHLAGLPTDLLDNAKVNGIEVLPAFATDAPGFGIRAGAGTVVGGFGADTGFDGGETSTVTKGVDTGSAADPAPQAVYQSERFGSFTYTVAGLTPAAPYRVRLHFAETWFGEVGDRLFNVSVNGVRVLTRFDIVAAAGGRDKAVVRECLARADGAGRITLAFRGAKPLLPLRDAHELAEDYVTALGEDGSGRLWVGHRRASLEVLDEATGDRVLPISPALPPMDYVSALLPRPDDPTLVGLYQGGLVPVEFPRPVSARPPLARLSAAGAVAPLPMPAGVPTLAELNAMLRTVRAVPPDRHELAPKAVALDDDWLTGGDWLGRYGRYWACLAATFHPIPEDYVWGAGWETVDYKLRMGPHHDPGDSLRYWLQWRYTKDPRVLELPAAYLHSRVLKGYTTWEVGRREAEVDDHGEAYPVTQAGPNVYCTLSVPPGLYYLSLYEFNKDDHDPWGGNRFRDFTLSVRPHGDVPLEDVAAFPAQPEWAHGRVRDFWGGVWKRFLVRGPQTLTVEVGRNGSLDTILPAVMLDLVDEDPAPYFQTVDAWKAREARREQERRTLTAQWPTAVRRFQPAASASEAAGRLFDALEEKRLTNSAWWATEGRRYYAPLLRWYAQPGRRLASSAQTRLSQCLATCHYQLGQYAAWEADQKAAHLTTAREVEKSLRWDGVTPSYSGLGYEIVTAHLAGPASRQASQSH